MRTIALILIAGVVLAACGAARDFTATSSTELPLQSSNIDPTLPSQSSSPEQAEFPVETAENPTVAPELINPRNDSFEAYLPPRLIGPDGIRPIYDPQFVSAADAPLDDDELVIGVALEGEAKAYPITVLRFREMVNDELGGLPILVTW